MNQTPEKRNGRRGDGSQLARINLITLVRNALKSFLYTIVQSWGTSCWRRTKCWVDRRSESSCLVHRASFTVRAKVFRVGNSYGRCRRPISIEGLHASKNERIRRDFGAGTLPYGDISVCWVAMAVRTCPGVGLEYS